MDKKKLARVIATWVITGIMVFVFTLDIFVNIKMNRLINDADKKFQTVQTQGSDDKIHFLNTKNSDCIILESNGKFALIDSGEGNQNPRRSKEHQIGSEETVIKYIEDVCKDKSGNISFDFAIATHMHYDHSGNFQAIINHPKVKIEKFYIKEYNGELAGNIDSENWGNKLTYERIITSLRETNTPIEHNVPKKEFKFEDFTIKFINTDTPDSLKNTGENANSIGVKLQKNNFTAFLGADFTNDGGFEMIYAKEINKVDLLKIGHHGYFGSSSKEFLEILKPETGICTNYIGKIYPNVKWNLVNVSNTAIFSTAQRNGIIAEINDNGSYTLRYNIHS